MTDDQHHAVSRTEFAASIDGLVDGLREESKIRSREIDRMRSDQREDMKLIRGDISALAEAFAQPTTPPTDTSGGWRSGWPVFSLVLILFFTLYGYNETQLRGVEDKLQSALINALTASAVSNSVHHGDLIAALQDYDTKQDANTVSRADAMQRALEKAIVAVKEHFETKVNGAGEASRALNSMQADQIQVNRGEVGLLRAWVQDHDFHVRGKNSGQDERLNALERQHFGDERKP